MISKLEAENAGITNRDMPRFRTAEDGLKALHKGDFSSQIPRYEVVDGKVAEREEWTNAPFGMLLINAPNYWQKSC